MAARETGPGASSPGRASAGEEESDDEWPDVSDHEDEGDATTPIWSSSGSRPGGTSEARPSASAATASKAASPASEDLPAHGFHIARSASAFGPAPDETARAPPAVGDAAPASAETKNAGWVERKTGDSLGALFGGDAPAIAAIENLETHVSLESLAGVGDAENSKRAPNAATNATNATRATAPSPFRASALAGYDDDFFDALASPAKKTNAQTRDTDAPFGAPPPPNTSQTQNETIAEATPTAAPPPSAYANRDAQTLERPAAETAAAHAPPLSAYPAYAAPAATEKTVGDLNGVRDDAAPSAYDAPRPAYVTQDYAHEASLQNARPVPTLLPPPASFSRGDATATFMVPAAAEIANGAERAPSGPEATRTDAAMANPSVASVTPYVPPAPADAAPAYDAAPALSAYAALAARGADRARATPASAEGYAGYAAYPADSLGASRTFGYPASYASYARMRLRVVTVHRRWHRGIPSRRTTTPRTPGGSARTAARRSARAARSRGASGRFPGRFPGRRRSRTRAIRRRRRRRRRRSRSRRS